MAEKKKKFYAVAAGRVPGIYSRWFGDTGAHAQVHGFPGAVYKGFGTYEEARAFMDSPPKPFRRKPSAGNGRSKTAAGKAPKNEAPPPPAVDGDRIVIYTDGGARPTNPGPGGYGAVILDGDGRRELSGGFALTTNNRMEILACIRALEALDKPARVTIHSDSRYVVNAVNKGWAKGWQKRGWIKSDKKPALNADLWKRLLELLEKHDADFVWVKGHAGTAENERCDQLATEAAQGGGLSKDPGYP